jgi:hypothetical protein
MCEQEIWPPEAEEAWLEVERRLREERRHVEAALVQPDDESLERMIAGWNAAGESEEPEGPVEPDGGPYLTLDRAGIA